MSPKHPATFAVGANDKLSQNLEWDNDTQTLFAKVTYSEVSGGGEDEMDPANYKTYALPFPTVKLDQNNNLVAINDTHDQHVVGHLEGGPFGTNVVLRRNVQLIAHRRDGKLSARLIVGLKEVSDAPLSTVHVQVVKPSF
jgi:hypothetical protein